MYIQLGKATEWATATTRQTTPPRLSRGQRLMPLTGFGYRECEAVTTKQNDSTPGLQRTASDAATTKEALNPRGLDISRTRGGHGEANDSTPGLQRTAFDAATTREAAPAPGLRFLESARQSQRSKRPTPGLKRTAFDAATTREAAQSLGLRYLESGRPSRQADPTPGAVDLISLVTRGFLTCG